MARRRPILLLAPLAGALIGLVLALAFPWPHGATHSCPSGVPIAACYYPADLTAQRLLWTGIGLAIGLLIAATTWIVSAASAQNIEAMQPTPDSSD